MGFDFQMMCPVDDGRDGCVQKIVLHQQIIGSIEDDSQ